MLQQARMGALGSTDTFHRTHRNFSNRANYAQFFRLQRTAELVLKRGTQNSSPFRARSHKCPLTTFYAAKKKRNALNVLLIYIYRDENCMHSNKSNVTINL